MKMTKDSPEHVDLNLWSEYDKSVKRFNDLQKSLKASREQRLKDRTEEGLTLTKVIQRLSNREAQKRAGEEAAIMDLLRNKEKEKLEKEGFIIESGERDEEKRK